jgi:enoyl-CoA hydratase/carnithine racemase
VVDGVVVAAATVLLTLVVATAVVVVTRAGAVVVGAVVAAVVAGGVLVRGVVVAEAVGTGAFVVTGALVVTGAVVDTSAVVDDGAADDGGTTLRTATAERVSARRRRVSRSLNGRRRTGATGTGWTRGSETSVLTGTATAASTTPDRTPLFAEVATASDGRAATPTETTAANPATTIDVIRSPLRQSRLSDRRHVRLPGRDSREFIRGAPAAIVSLRSLGPRTRSYLARDCTRGCTRRPRVWGVRLRLVAFQPLQTQTQLTQDVVDRILVVTLNRPERLNAFTLTMAQELVGAIDRADADDEVRAVVVTGAGRGFCAGADLGSGSSTFDAGAEGAKRAEKDPAALRDVGGLVTLRLFESRKPLIAAINGPAVGVGVTMTLPMDIRLASSSAKFGFVFARRGIVPEAASSWFLPRLVGISKAAEWCFSGRVFDAEEALAGGLVRSIHAPDDLLEAALAIGREIAQSTSAVSVAMTRQMLWRMLGADHPMAAHQIDSRAVFALGRSNDAHEGVASFLEKRAAVFTNSAANDMPEFFPWWDDPVYR